MAYLNTEFLTHFSVFLQRLRLFSTLGSIILTLKKKTAALKILVILMENDSFGNIFIKVVSSACNTLLKQIAKQNFLNNNFDDIP